MAMHSNWNPWHGCIKCSEGCQNCYVYYLDRMRGKSGADVYKTKTSFKYPLAKDKSKKYKIQSGEMISVCMTSDFFLEEADEWRPEAWEMMRKRSDVIFLLLTKRPKRIQKCLPSDWGTGWDITFCFMETGTKFIKDGHKYRISNKALQNSQAVNSGMTYQGKPMIFELKDDCGRPIPKEDLYVPRFCKKCEECSFRILCNGCFNCGGCEGTGSTG